MTAEYVETTAQETTLGIYLEPGEKLVGKSFGEVTSLTNEFAAKFCQQERQEYVGTSGEPTGRKGNKRFTIAVYYNPAISSPEGIYKRKTYRGVPVRFDPQGVVEFYKKLSS